MSLFQKKGEFVGFEKIVVDANMGMIEKNKVSRPGIEIRTSMPKSTQPDFNDPSDDDHESMPEKEQDFAANDSGLGVNTQLGSVVVAGTSDDDNNTASNENSDKSVDVNSVDAVSAFYNNSLARINAIESTANITAPAGPIHQDIQNPTDKHPSGKDTRTKKTPQQTAKQLLEKRIGRAVNITKDPIEHTLSNTGSSEFMRVRIDRAIAVKKRTQLIFDPRDDDFSIEQQLQNQTATEMHKCHICQKVIQKKNAKDHALRHGNDYYYNDSDEISEENKIVFVTVLCPAKNNPCKKKFFLGA